MEKDILTKFQELLLKALYLEQINKLDKTIIDELNTLMIQLYCIQPEIEEIPVEIIGYFALLERLTKNYKENHIINTYFPGSIKFYEILFENLGIDYYIKVENQALKVFTNKKDIQVVKKELKNPENNVPGIYFDVESFPEDYNNIIKSIELLKNIKENYLDLAEKEQIDIDFSIKQLLENIGG